MLTKLVMPTEEISEEGNQTLKFSNNGNHYLTLCFLITLKKKLDTTFAFRYKNSALERKDILKMVLKNPRCILTSV